MLAKRVILFWEENLSPQMPVWQLWGWPLGALLCSVSREGCLQNLNQSLDQQSWIRDRNVAPPQADTSAGGQEDLKIKEHQVIRVAFWDCSNQRFKVNRVSTQKNCCYLGAMYLVVSGFLLWKTIEKTKHSSWAVHTKKVCPESMNPRKMIEGGSQRQTLKKGGRQCLQRAYFQSQREKQRDPDRKRWEEIA